ncbi:FtsX-like permease family protein [Anaerocolumna sedimenticola]|uniref:FtsX-like permease family protein n=1 Tax=Anaerocolumna sedimenticola TaxID=2696063 RepID=A0A6P1TPQ7_9FIRM|nr:FtsX-like permease family protein [Anaerocolumna sedimenticola]QHQ63240.1 FtsX-like permease family protein [Anaerocolumna sedimenticola]
MVINKRIRRVLLENKAQYIGSILLIIFSCFLFTNLVLVSNNLIQLMNEYANDYVQEDASFTTDKSINNLDTLSLTSDLVIEEGKTFDYSLSEGITLRIFTENDKINIPAVTQGKNLNSSGDILLNPTFAAAQGIKIGDVLTIGDKQFTVTGFMMLPNYIVPLKSETDLLYSPQSFGIAVISREDFAAFRKGSNFYAVKFNHKEDSARSQSKEFLGLLKSRGIDILQWTDIGVNVRVSGAAAKFNSASLMGRAMPITVLLLTAVLLSNVIGRMIKRESVIAGALYALGYKRKELYLHYLKFPLVIAGIGGILGTILGIFTVRSLLSVYFEFCEIPMTGIEYSLAVIILSFIFPIIFLGISVFLVIHKELGQSPAELMKGDREKNKVNFLERRFKLEKLKFTVKFKFREQLRSLSRLILLLTGCITATLLLLFGFFLKSGMNYFLTTEVKNSQNYQYEYVFENLRTEPAPAGSEPFAVSKFMFQGDDNKVFHVAGVLPDSKIMTVLDESGKKLRMDQVIITKPIADRLKVKRGDTITIVRKSDYQEFTLRVGGIASSYNMTISMPLSEYNEKFGMPEGSYNGLFGNKPLDIPKNEEYTVLSIEDKIAAIQSGMVPLKATVFFISAVAFIIGMIIIYIVTSVIIEENKSTISLMKIFGYRKREINSLILNSSTIVVIMGYIIGIPLSFAIMGGLMKALENSAPFAMPVTIEPIYIGVGFIVVMFSYEISKWLCKKKVNAISMSDALKAGAE